MSKLSKSTGYKSALSVYETQTAIGSVKRIFEDRAVKALYAAASKSAYRRSTGICLG